MINDVPLFAGLSDQQKTLIAEGIKIHHYPKMTVLLTKGDLSSNLYILLSGRLKAYITNSSGREIVLDFLDPHTAFGELSLLDRLPRSCSISAVEDSKLAILTRQHVINCIEKHPSIALALLATLAERNRSLIERVGDLALLDVYGRVANILIERARKVDNQTIRITHQEIANLVGSSREMITRILNDLKKGGYISLAHNQIIINNQLPSKW